MNEVGRNALCPCASGKKFKHCCLRREQEFALDVTRAEGIWHRMQDWALGQFGDELGDSLKEHMDVRGVGSDERPATDEDLSLSLCWLLIDRGLADGGDTPAQRYAKLLDLSQSEREIAMRIAESRLGIYRVIDAAPGSWIDFENVFDGTRQRVMSPNVSRETVRWHVLLCRVMEGGPARTLWGGVAFYEPPEEAELIVELQRIASTNDLGTGPVALESAMRIGAGELVCFIPASRRAERVPYTTEGDIVSIAEASWRVGDTALALHKLYGAPELAPGGETDDEQGRNFDWLASRRDLLARRGALPVGALCIESGPLSVDDDGDVDLEDVTLLGTFTLRGDRLEFTGLSEQRMAAALSLIERHLGDLVSDPICRVRSIEDVRSTTPTNRETSPVARRHAAPHADQKEIFVPEAVVRELTYRRWVDDPNHQLGGLSPREAVARGGHRDQLESLIRNFEYHSAYERTDRLPGPEVAWIRAELGLDTERITA